MGRNQYFGANSIVGSSKGYVATRGSLARPTTREDRRIDRFAKAARVDKSTTVTTKDRKGYLAVVARCVALNDLVPPPINKALRLEVELVGNPRDWAKQQRGYDTAMRRARAQLVLGKPKVPVRRSRRVETTR